MSEPTNSGNKDTRSHTPSSFSRTSHLSPKDRASMEKVKQPLTFADSAVSSATTTPQKGVPTFEVDKPSQHHLLEQPILGDNEVLISPEQLKELASLLDNPTVLFEILEKLHQLQAYLKDAMGLYEELKKGNMTDPQETQQLVKMATIVGDIKQHELSYMRMLQQLMVKATATRDNAQESDHDEEEQENEQDVNQEEREDGASTGESEEEEEENQQEEEMTNEQKRELEDLMQQKVLLERLLQQQNQLRALEEKQASLLALRKDAEARLAQHLSKKEEVDEIVADLNRSTDGASSPQKEQLSEDWSTLSSPSKGKSQEDDGQSGDEEHRAKILGELHELRSKQERLNRLLVELENSSTSNAGELPAEAMPQDLPSNLSNSMKSRVSSLPSRASNVNRSSHHPERMKVTWSAPTNQSAVGREQVNGPHSATEPPQQAVRSEVVADHEGTGEVVSAELEDEKFKRLQNVSEKLTDVQRLLAHSGLNDSSIASSPEKSGNWNNRAASQSEDDSQYDRTLTEEEIALKEEYEAKIQQQKMELQSLADKKKELMQLRELLRNLHIEQQEELNRQNLDETCVPQHHNGKSEGAAPPEIPLVVQQQHQMYEELVQRNRQSRKMQRENGGDDQDANSVQYSCDVTAATWGGSTAYTMESETTSENMSEAFDDTRALENEDGNEPLMVMTGGSAVLEQGPGSRDTYSVHDVPVSVERHAPRHLSGLQRKNNESTEDLGVSGRSSGKKRRLDGDQVPDWQSSGFPPYMIPPNPYMSTSPVRPPSSYARTRPPRGETGSSMYDLQRQLAESNSMCTELLRGHMQLVNLLTQPQRMNPDYSRQHYPFSSNSPFNYQQPPAAPPSASHSLRGGVPTLDEYMQQLDGYHVMLQEAYHRLCTQQQQHSFTFSPGRGFQKVPQSGAAGFDGIPPPPVPPHQAGLFGDSSQPLSYNASFNLSAPSGEGFRGFSPQLFGQVSQPNNMAYTGARQNGSDAKVSEALGPNPPTSHLHTASGTMAASLQVMASPQSVSTGNPLGKSHSLFGRTSNPTSSGTGRAKDAPSVSGKAQGGSNAAYYPKSKGEAYDFLAGRARELALEEHNISSGVRQVASEQHLLQGDSRRDVEEESVSSLPCSLPDNLEVAAQKRAAKRESQSTDNVPQQQGYSLFDALRESIYSEVATLIANNEARPHFLIELFRELQLLTTDYLRQRALYSIQDLVTRFLTEEGLETEGYNPLNYQMYLGSTSEQTPSESAVTSEAVSEGEVVAGVSRHKMRQTSKQAYDYAEPVESASSISTPPAIEDPFASDNLGDTVIKFGDSLQQVRSMESSLTEGDATLVHSPAEQQNAGLLVDPQQLDGEIKQIMMCVIPIMKDHLQEPCTAELLQIIQHHIVSLVLNNEQPLQEFAEIFQKQVEASLGATMAKYQGRILKDCGEDLLVDLSEVLFNELGFFRVLQDMKVDPGALLEMPQDSGGSQDKPEGLASTGTATLQDEEETLGKNRDDQMAESCEYPKVLSTSATTEEDIVLEPENDVPLNNRIAANFEISDDNVEPKETKEEQEEQEEAGTEAGSSTKKEEEPPLEENLEQQTEAAVDHENESVDEERSQSLKEERDASLEVSQNEPDPLQPVEQSSVDNPPPVEDDPPPVEDDPPPVEEDTTSESTGPVLGVTSLNQTLLAAQHAEEQKTVTGIEGVLGSLNQVPELAGQDVAVEPASIPEP